MQAPAITIITPWYGHFAGGAEVAARSFATQFAGRGFQVQVLTTCCRGPFDNWWQNTLAPGTETIDGVAVRRFPVNTDGEQRFHFVNAKVSRGAALDENEQREFIRNTINSDALVDFAGKEVKDHLVLAMPYTQGLVHAAAHALNGRMVLVPCLHNEAQAGWKTTSEMIAQCRALLYLTEEEKSLAIHLYGHRFGRRVIESPVVGVGVELPANIQPLIEDAARRDEICQRYDLPRTYFVYAGRKDVGKNVPRLVEWFAEHIGQGGHGELICIGGGDASLIGSTPYIRDLGFVPEADKYAILSRADALINLSENESFSLVIAEAWLCGVPVVVSARSPVAAGHCDKSEGGIPVNDFEEFHEALNQLADDDVRACMAAGGARYVRRNYAWDQVLDRVIRGAA